MVKGPIVAHLSRKLVRCSLNSMGWYKTIIDILFVCFPHGNVVDQIISVRTKQDIVWLLIMAFIAGEQNGLVVAVWFVVDSFSSFYSWERLL